MLVCFIPEMPNLLFIKPQKTFFHSKIKTIFLKFKSRNSPQRICTNYPNPLLFLLPIARTENKPNKKRENVSLFPLTSEGTFPPWNIRVSILLARHMRLLPSDPVIAEEARSLSQCTLYIDARTNTPEHLSRSLASTERAIWWASRMEWG